MDIDAINAQLALVDQEIQLPPSEMLEDMYNPSTWRGKAIPEGFTVDFHNGKKYLFPNHPEPTCPFEGLSISLLKDETHTLCGSTFMYQPYERPVHRSKAGYPKGESEEVAYIEDSDMVNEDFN